MPLTKLKRAAAAASEINSPIGSQTSRAAAAKLAPIKL